MDGLLMDVHRSNSGLSAASGRNFRSRGRGGGFGNRSLISGPNTIPIGGRRPY